MASVGSRNARGSARLLLILAVGASILLLVPSSSFVAGSASQSSRLLFQKTAMRQQVGSSVEVMPTGDVSLAPEADDTYASIEDRVEALRRASFEACMAAREDSPAEEMERCRLLSYELAVAEKKLLMRQDYTGMDKLDSDSY